MRTFVASTFAVLWTLDLLTTAIFLSMGLTEANPIARFLHENFGLVGMAVAKLASGVLVCYLVMTFDRAFVYVIAVFNLLILAVVLNNVLYILGVV